MPSTSNLIATLAAFVTLGLGVYGYLQYVVAVRSYNVGPWKDCRDRLDVKKARVCRQYANLTYDDVATRRSFYASWQEALFISSEETAGGPNLTYHGNASPPARSQVSTKPMADDRVRELRYQGMLHGSAAHVRSGQGTSTAPWLLLCILLGLLVLRSWSRPRGPSKEAPTVVSIMIFAKGVLASKVLQGNRPKLAPG